MRQLRRLSPSKKGDIFALVPVGYWSRKGENLRVTMQIYISFALMWREPRALGYRESFSRHNCSRAFFQNPSPSFCCSRTALLFSFPSFKGGLRDHFDNYFTDSASVHKYQTRLASLQ